MPYHPLQDPGHLPRTAYSGAAGPAPSTARLDGEERADIAIVGAGFTGLSAALHAAEAGAKEIVLEANEIGWGASGRNFGQVVPYLRHPSARALAVLGPDYGQRMIDAAGGGPDLVFGLIEKHAMQCQSVRNGLIFAAHTPDKVKALEARTEEWRRRGAPVEMYDAKQTKELIGGGSYWGCSLDKRGGTINALGYMRGLARAAMAAGAVAHTGSRAMSLKRDGKAWKLETLGGRVIADTVMLGTGAYTDDLWPGLRASLMPFRSYGVASRPVGENARATILPGKQALTDTRRLTSGVRLHADGRIHVSSDRPRFGPEGRPDTARITRRMLAMFPQLGSIEWEIIWSGWIDLTPTQFPELHELAPGLLAGLGYSGRGIALATVMGREMARCALGTAPKHLSFAITKPKPVPFGRFYRPALNAAMRFLRAKEAIDLARYGAGPKVAAGAASMRG
jgi:glycine/D-amino acid oxidase-like deaminating enzyme